jgi:hypothetical protein
MADQRPFHQHTAKASDNKRNGNCDKKRGLRRWTPDKAVRYLLKPKSCIGSHHNELAMSQVDDIHQTKGKSQAQRYKEQNRTQAQPVEKLKRKYFHTYRPALKAVVFVLNVIDFLELLAASAKFNFYLQQVSCSPEPGASQIKPQVPD